MEDFSFPNLPFQKREKKPRDKGINYVRAPVMVGQCINDYLSAYGNLVDVFKLSGKQAALMSTSALKEFISTCRKHEVLVAVGNPVMDVALGGGTEVVDDFLESAGRYGIDIIEISSIARAIDDDDISTDEGEADGVVTDEDCASAVCSDHGDDPWNGVHPEDAYMN